MWWWTDLFCEWEMFVLCLLMLLCLLWEVLVSRGNNQSKSEDSWATWIWGRWLQVIILFQAFWSISIEIHILDHFLTNCLLIFTIIIGITATIIYPVIITRAKISTKIYPACARVYNSIGPFLQESYGALWIGGWRKWSLALYYQITCTIIILDYLKIVYKCI